MTRKNSGEMDTLWQSLSNFLRRIAISGQILGQSWVYAQRSDAPRRSQVAHPDAVHGQMWGRLCSRPQVWSSALSLLAATLVLTSSSTAVQADVFYYCTDKNGNTWMTDHKKPGARCKIAMDTGGGRSLSSGPPRTLPTATGSDLSLTSAPKPLERPLTSAAMSSGSQAPDSSVQEAIRAASQKFQIPEELIHAVILVESGYNPNAVSRVGAVGLMQLMPETGKEYGVADLYDARQNIFGGTKYLRWLANYFNGDIIKTLSAYHAGPGAVNDKNGIPYTNTEAYVKKVLSHYYRLKDETAAQARSNPKP